MQGGIAVGCIEIPCRKKMGLENMEGMSTAKQPVVQIKERLLRVWFERELDQAQCVPLK